MTKRIANFTSKKCKWQQFKSKIEIWPECMDSLAAVDREKNDFNRFKKNNNAPTLTDFYLFLKKKADYKQLQDQTQFNWMVHFINNLETKRQRSVCMYVCARPKKAGKWGDARAPNSQSQSRMNEPVF